MTIDIISETQAVHLLPVLMRLEGQDRPQHRRHGGGHGAYTPGQVREQRFFRFQIIRINLIQKWGRATQRGVQEGQSYGAGPSPGCER